MPTKLSLIAAAILSLMFTVSSAASLSVGDLITAVLCFVSASAVLSFFLIFVRRPISFIVPVLSAAVSALLGVNVLISTFVACGVTVFAVMYALCHMKLVTSFNQFLITALCYTVCGGGFFCFLAGSIYGSVSAGVIAFGEKIASFAPMFAQLAEQNGADYNTAYAEFSALLSGTHLYLPAIIATLGVMCAWLMRGVFVLYTAVSGIPSLFGGRRTTAPKSLAAVFLIITLFGVLLTLLPKGTAFAVVNIRSMLSTVFLGEGARIFFSPRKGRRRSHPALVMGLLVLVFFFPFIIPVILPYYGAVGVLMTRSDAKPAQTDEK